MADCRCGSEFCSICNPENSDAENDGKIEVRLDAETHDALMRIFVEKNLRREAIDTFNDYIDAGCNTSEALSHAVINEMAIRAFIDQAEREQLEETLKNKEE